MPLPWIEDEGQAILSQSNVVQQVLLWNEITCRLQLQSNANFECNLQ